MMNIFRSQKSFKLESGIEIPDFHLAYTTYGQLNEEKNNVVWIFHALTANSDAAEWWPGLVGKNKLFDPDQYFIICVNMPGSCYGSIGPLDTDPLTGTIYYHRFPLFTTRDMIRSYQQLKNYLGIQKVFIGIGGSMGGQQLLEWAVEEPALFTYIIPLATNSFHSPWGIAFNATQRHSIENDPSWKNKDPKAGLQGMAIAREIAILSYRNYHTYQLNQREEDTGKTGQFKSESYQQYQGKKLVKRFNAFSYFFLSKAMDAHHIGRGRNTVEEALQTIKAGTLVISISSDLLFPPGEQQWLAEHVRNGVHIIIDSDYGHDGFLLEYDKIGNAISEFITQ
ncbi:MAG: homoserine O-acetyltransferase [Chitinophagaceae bacterium]|nr:homoserine O-acetyltransferase [Chitinophagaceae bacterium]MDP3667299.1 homoserine O-acetyltransferase [Sediminibacterium sp.]